MKQELIAARLDALRSELRKLNLDGFLVPMADEFQCEYVPASSRRVEFISGFTGSAGFVIILKDRAAFFTDSRYTLQASQQIDKNLFEIFDAQTTPPTDWLKAHAPKSKIGFDPKLHTAASMDRFLRALDESDIRLVQTTANPIDLIWKDRPVAQVRPAYSYLVAYAGKSSLDKRTEIAAQLEKNKIDAAVIADPSSVAWLLNVRGHDTPNTPLALSHALLRKDASVLWFIDPAKVTDALCRSFDDRVTILPFTAFTAELEKLGRSKSRVRIDKSNTSVAHVETLETAGATLAFGEDPCLLPRACKNATELNGIREAHKRDGVAIVSFLAWLEKNADITELDVDEKLTSFRKTQPLYQEPSFDTIAGSGAHGAIVHYRATPETNQKLPKDTFLLLDSGAQYLDGTTDITRTITVGAVSAEHKDRFTRVLKGHIALAKIRFPATLTGANLDVLARQYLWEIGLDYGHGTGHGVGCFLGVHEGPQSISSRGQALLRPGMVLSNEPGFYKEGAYGIRIENLQTVVPLPHLGTPENPMLGFETLTLVPIDKNAIDVSLLTHDERAWLDAYHQRVKETLMPLITDPTVQTWLETATARL